MADVVSIVLKLEQVRQFVSGTERASRGVERLGQSAEESGRRAKVGWKGLAKFAGGAAALYGAQRFLRSSVSAVEDLGKATMTLQRTTGMDVETASAWAAIAKSRNLNVKQLQVGFVKLSKEMEKSRMGTGKQAAAMAALNDQYREVQKQGGKKAPAALTALSKKMAAAQVAGAKTRATLAGLGVTQKALAAGNTSAVINQVAQGLSKMTNPARRAAIAQQLFGRGGQALLPILLKGRKGIQDQMAVVRKYGATLGVKTVDQLKELIGNQREMNIAMQGAKVQLGTALLPVILLLTTGIVKLTRALAPLTKNALLLKIAIAAVVILFVAYKVAMLAATIAQTAFNVSLGLTTLYIGLIIVVLAALVIGFIIAYKRVGWFRAAVDATWKAVKVAASFMLTAFKKVWSWIKANWPLLLGILTGPFGLAVVLIIKHFDKIKKAVQGVVDSIKGIFNRLLDFVRDIPGRVTGILGRAGGVLGGVVGHLGIGGGDSSPSPAAASRPRPVTPRAAPLAAVAAAGGGGRALEVHVPVHVDGKPVAKAVARVTADQMARR